MAREINPGASLLLGGIRETCEPGSDSGRDLLNNLIGIGLSVDITRSCDELCQAAHHSGDLVE